MFLVAIFIADIILTNNLLFFSSLNIKNNKNNKNMLSKNILDFNKYDFIKNNLYKSHLPLVSSKKRDMKNEIKFLKNNNTKVYIHVEEIIVNSNIYHVGITFKTIFKKMRYDIMSIDMQNNYNINNKNKYRKTIFWDYSNKSLNEIIDYEKRMNYCYFIGVYDCRHYVRNLTQWSCNNPTPIWKLHELLIE